MQISMNWIKDYVNLDGIETDVLNLKSKKGNVVIQNFKNEAAKLTLKGNFTNFDLKNITYASCSATTLLGNINLSIENEQVRTSVLETWLGDVSILCDIPTSAFKLNLSTTLGSVMRNGEAMGKEHNSSSQNTCRISANTILGDVSISFTGGNEEDYISVDTTPPETEEAPLTDESNLPETGESNLPETNQAAA